MKNYDEALFPAFGISSTTRSSPATTRAASSDQRQAVGGTKPYTYSASPSGVVVVDASGVVVARSVGKATVTVTDSTLPLPGSASYAVEVTSPPVVIVVPTPTWIPPYEQLVVETLPSGLFDALLVSRYPGWQPSHMINIETNYRILSTQEEKSVMGSRGYADPTDTRCKVDGDRLRKTYELYGATALKTRVYLYFSSSTPDGSPDMIGGWSVNSVLNRG
jgi:hypothetical protein